ncbi:alanyl-tRNA editing protein [Allisonella histaminiformans]|uniref:alanyl-tRNA editing protein n=1 Tax=Allisonella histaminiformans TaxID=209880 RepID=UPI0024094640|nr:DHHA1 domain-containing protein [Allisonella histaminiformans]MDD6871109.1 DHHA1 domain-containing protein [Allisonella histaminiformans]
MEEMNELFYRDEYAREFDAEVISCQKGKKGYEVVLSDTAFYPEGGGQPADRGTLGQVNVLDVKRRNGKILHITDAPLEPGMTVHGVLDWERRFDHMQQHSGEHILSGLVHAQFGYDNVGFHMNDEVVTVDFNGPITWEEAMELEDKVNAYIWTDAESRELYPSEEELKAMDYRSKIELKGKVRLVEYPGADLCACCGTHVAHTGEIGLMKILSVSRHKDGVRMEMLFGGRAMKDYDRKHLLNTEFSCRLSAKPYETGEALQRVLDEMNAMKFRMQAMNERYYAMRATSIPVGEPVIFFNEPGMSMVEIRKFCDYLISKGKVKTAMIISPKDKESVNYVMGSADLNMRDVGKLLNEELHGRGGGRPEMVQGSFQAEAEAVEQAFRRAVKA